MAPILNNGIAIGQNNPEMIPMLVHPVIFTNEVIAVDSDWNDVASAASPNMPTVNPINVENTNAAGPTISYNRRSAANSSLILVEFWYNVSIPFLQWACRNNLTNAACVLAFAFDIAFLFSVGIRYRGNFPMDGVRYILGNR